MRNQLACCNDGSVLRELFGGWFAWWNTPLGAPEKRVRVLFLGALCLHYGYEKAQTEVGWNWWIFNGHNVKECTVLNTGRWSIQWWKD